ncbi:MAG: hypothetical protein QE271_08395 [Bacteriovoracaceae bacterium]|nr:hypothetical protein [Bacteriovoracaceae bacterium]
MKNSIVKNSLYVISSLAIWGTTLSNGLCMGPDKSPDNPVKAHKEELKQMPVTDRLAFEISHNEELLGHWQKIKQHMGWIECSDSIDTKNFGLMGLFAEQKEKNNAPIKMTLKYKCESLDEWHFKREGKFWANYRNGVYDITKYQITFEDVYSKYSENLAAPITYDLEKNKLKNEKREHIRRLVSKNKLVQDHVDDLIYRNSLVCSSPTIRYPLVKLPMGKYMEMPQTLMIETACAVLDLKGHQMKGVLAQLKVKVKYNLDLVNEENPEMNRISVEKSQITISKSYEMEVHPPVQVSRI